MTTTIMSVLVPTLMLTMGLVLIVRRQRIALWYRGFFSRATGHRLRRMERQFNSASMVMVGAFAVLVGGVSLANNIQRLL